MRTPKPVKVSYILSRKHARKSDPDFVVAAARAIYCDHTLSRMDEKGTTPGGCELTEVLPETQPWAFNLARQFTVEFAAACMGARKAHEFPIPNYPASLIQSCANKIIEKLELMAIDHPAKYADRERTEENLGWYAAMQAMGHGVGLDQCGIDFPYHLPHLEAWPC